MSGFWLGKVPSMLQTLKNYATYYARLVRPAPAFQHYDDWRAKRIAAITDHYGAAWFRGRSLLEVGCGHGDIGAAFADLGARVTCSDAVAEHLEVTASRHPKVQVVRADLDAGWPFPGRYDLVLHLGVLYHLADPASSIRQALGAADHVVLETVVADSDDPSLSISTTEKGLDQAFNRVGSRPSPAFVERVLAAAGRSFKRITDDRCNSGYHVYNWTPGATGSAPIWPRAMWFVGPPDA